MYYIIVLSIPPPASSPALPTLFTRFAYTRSLALWLLLFEPFTLVQLTRFVGQGFFFFFSLFFSYIPALFLVHSFLPGRWQNLSWTLPLLFFFFILSLHPLTTIHKSLASSFSTLQRIEKKNWKENKQKHPTQNLNHRKKKRNWSVKHLMRFVSSFERGPVDNNIFVFKDHL